MLKLLMKVFIQRGIFLKKMRFIELLLVALILQVQHSQAIENDHIIPLNKGGKTVAENLQVLCRKCNASKSDKVMDI